MLKLGKKDGGKRGGKVVETSEGRIKRRERGETRGEGK